MIFGHAMFKYCMYINLYTIETGLSSVEETVTERRMTERRMTERRLTEGRKRPNIESLMNMKANMLIVRYHCGGRPMKINACVLNSYMVYL